MSEQEIAKVKRNNGMRLGWAFVLCAAIIAAQIPPLSHWRWHNYLVGVPLVLIALDWFRLAAQRRNELHLALAVYTSIAVVGTFIEKLAHPHRALMIGIAAGSVAAAVVTLALAARQGLRWKELDRYIFSEASSLAFFATMFTVVTFALLHEWLKIDAPDPFVFAAIGGGAWVVAAIALRRRYN